jgi:hypothetical protein
VVRQGLWILHDGCEVELIARAGETPKAHALNQSIFRKSGRRFSARKCDHKKKLERFLVQSNRKAL